MSKEMKNTRAPKLRFPECREAGAWEEKSLGDAINSESSLLAQGKLQFVKGGYPVYGAEGLLGFTSTYSQKEDYIAIIKDGSGVGKLFLYKKESSVIGTLTYLKTKDHKKYNLNWLFYLLQTVDFSSYVKGSGIPHIYFSDYSKQTVAIPYIPEQQKIAATLTTLDELLIAEGKRLAALQAHKKGLMQQLFPAEGETAPRVRFGEFEGEWEKKTLGEVAKYENGKAHEQDISETGDFVVVNSKFISTEGEIKKYTNTPFCILVIKWFWSAGACVSN